MGYRKWLAIGLCVCICKCFSLAKYSIWKAGVRVIVLLNDVFIKRLFITYFKKAILVLCDLYKTLSSFIYAYRIYIIYFCIYMCVYVFVFEFVLVSYTVLRSPQTLIPFLEYLNLLCFVLLLNMITF